MNVEGQPGKVVKEATLSNSGAGNPRKFGTKCSFTDGIYVKGSVN